MSTDDDERGSRRTNRRKALSVFLIASGALGIAALVLMRIGPHGPGDAACRNVVPLVQQEAISRDLSINRITTLAPACHGFYRFEGDNELDCFVFYPNTDPKKQYGLSATSIRGAMPLWYYPGIDFWQTESGSVVRFDRRFCAFPFSIQKDIELTSSAY